MADYNKRIIIEFDQDINGDLTGKQGAFTVTGKELLHVDGPLINKTYTVTATGRPDGTTKAIYLDFAVGATFRNAVGEIAITYSSGVGQISGLGGAVANFIINFSPTNLTPLNNPYDLEKITANASPNINYILLNKIVASTKTEHITAMPTISIIFIDLSVINP